MTSTTADLVLEGNYFDEQINIDLGPSVTINSLNNITPTSMTVNYTTSASTQTPTPVSMTRGSLSHFGNTPTIEVSNVLKGTGSAGTFTTNFDGGGSGQTAWGADWTLEIFGNVNSFDGYWNTSNGGTPSNNTGPASSFDGTNYLHTEVSDPNFGVGQYGQATTTNFRQLTQIDFDYFMYGAEIGALVVETQNADNTWTERWRRDGQQQTADTDAWLHATIDASTWDAKATRFIFEAATNWAGDVAIDNIVITSV